MTKLTWGQAGSRRFETGTDRGVLYPNDSFGVPWNGLVSVDENPDGGKLRAYYLDGQRYMNRSSSEEYNATIQAYSSPVEFDECDGTVALAKGLYITQQRRKSFGFSYRTRVGNDLDGIDHGYKLHLIYGAMANPSNRSRTTIGDSAEALLLSWDLETISQGLTKNRFSAHLILDSTEVYPWVLEEIENHLYGSDGQDAMLPSPLEILNLFENGAKLQITDNGDGTWTAMGEADVLEMVSPTEFKITSDSVEYIDPDTYNVSTL